MDTVTKENGSAITPVSAVIKTCVWPGAIGSQGGHDISESENHVPVRIFALGRFSVAIDGRQGCSEGKGKQRPLSLLKALIALGGRGVASNQIWECLWPDAEGDLGGRNLNITVHRLRLMLGGNAALLQHGSKLTLNAKICQVDAWDFERKVNDGLGRIEQSGTGDYCEAELRAAFALYAGHFLARESEESWMLTTRFRLKTKFERLVSALTTQLEHQKRYAEAMDLCLQALERDPLNELLYRRLMSCYLKQGEFSCAMRTYLRCREALAKGLAAPISSETERLHLEASRAAAERGFTQSIRLAPVLTVHPQSMQSRSIA